MVHDYSDYSDGPTVDQLGKITDAVDAYLDAQVDAAKAEAEYKERMKRVRHYEPNKANRPRPCDTHTHQKRSSDIQSNS